MATTRFTRPKALLLATSILYLIACVLLMCVAIALGGTLSRTKWSDFFGIVDSFPAIPFLVYSVVCLLVSVIVSCCRSLLPPTNKWLSTFACMFIIFAGVITVMGFRSMSVALEWKNSPGHTSLYEEESLALGFHQAICPARICIAPVNKFPQYLINSTVNATSTSTNMINLCKNSINISETSLSEFRGLCTICLAYSTQSTINQYSGVLKWIDSACSTTVDSDIFCDQFIKDNATNVTGSLYNQCRTPLLLHWNHYSTYAAVGGVMHVFAAIIYLMPRKNPKKTSTGKTREAYALVT